MSPQRSPVVRHFSTLRDPRRHRRKVKHTLVDIVVISICAALCGIDDFENMEVWAKSKEAWLRGFLTLEFGVPSHNTLNRLFQKISPAKFQECFLAWIQEIADLLPGEVVGIDGKTLRRTFDKASQKSAIHMVSAWATQNRLVLGQIKTDEKSNEITAIPKLLEALDLKGCLVTIDAMGTQREIAQKILDQEADYTLALKENQKSLYEDVVATFATTDLKNSDVVDHFSTVDRQHGRRELRNYYVISDIEAIQAKHSWPGLASIGLATTVRFGSDGKRAIEHRYYINSFAGSAERFGHAVRSHWGVENRLHWCLDFAAFSEDQCRTRKEGAPENLAVLRHVALNMLRRLPEKRSLRGKQIQCISNEEYLLKALTT